MNIEEKWVRNWVRGIASKLAEGGDVSREEFEREESEIEKIALEKGSKVYEIPKIWKRRLFEKITGLKVDELLAMKDEVAGRKIKEALL